MLWLATSALCLAFSPLEAPQLSRRQVVALGGFGALAFSPLPAHAQRSALVPRSNAESTASFKVYQLSKPGEATPEFLAAEKRRQEAANRPRGSGQAETAEQQMARLGLKTMTQAMDEGYDPCATWRGCNRK